MLTSSARRPTFRMVVDGTPVPHASLTTSVRLGGSTVDGVADLSKIGAHLADGATLVLQGLQRTWPPLVRFCRALERATSHPVQANAYLTPAGAAGLGEHADSHDVFVLQLLGTKTWVVDGIGTVDLRADDVLYMPAGTRHRASAQRDVSLHLTIGLLTDTLRAVLSRALAEVPGLDAALPLGWARPERADALADALRSALQRASSHLTGIQVGQLAATEAARATRRRRPLLDGHIASVLSAVERTTVVQWRSDNPVRLENDGDFLLVHLVDRSIRMPSHVRAAVNALTGRRKVEVGTLPGLDEAGRVVLARRLIREGALKVVAGAAPS